MSGLSHPRPLRRRGTVLLSALLLTAGCGAPAATGSGAGPTTASPAGSTAAAASTSAASASSAPSTPGAAASGGTGDSPAFLQHALTAAQQMTSVQGEITVQAGGSGSEKQVVTGTFIGSQAGGRMQTMSVDMTIAAKNQDLKIKMLAVDGNVYFGGDALLKELKVDKPWLQITADSDNPQIAALGQQLDSMRQGLGAEQIEKMQQAMVSSTEIGAEDIDGVPTTHYQVVIDIRKSLAALGSAAPSIPASADIPDTLPTDLWLDAQGRMIQTKVEQETSGKRVVTTVHATAYDVPVDITAPDPSQVSTG